MALVADRVRETTTTTGTGTYTLAGAQTGYRTFTSAFSNATVVDYAITDGTNWEVGKGTFTTSGTTLSRGTIRASSNAGSAVNWGAGTRDIWCNNAAALVPATGLALFTGPTVERLYTLPDAAATIARTDAAQTFTDLQTFGSALITTLLAGTISGTSCDLTSLVVDGLISGVAGTGAVIPKITPGANFILTQNSVAALTSVESGALVNSIYVSAGKVGLSTASPAARLHLAGNLSASSWTTAGIGLQVAAATYTDTSTAAAGTVSVRTANSFKAPTFASTNAITVTNAYGLYVSTPVAGTNTTITEKSSAYFDGPIVIGENGVAFSPADSLAGISVCANPAFEANVTVAKTDTTQRFPFTFRTNETPGVTDFNLQFLLQGAASSANRWFGIQVTDSGVGYSKLNLNPNGGNVGIGLTAPATQLHVLGADNSTVVTIGINATQANVTAADKFVSFTSTSGEEANVIGTAVAGVVAYNTFTGSHYTQSDEVDEDTVPGTVMVSVDEFCKWKGQENVTLPEAKVSAKKEDKAVYGVFGGLDSDGDVLVLAIGTGVVLVCDEGGKIEIGDLLCTSSLAGHAMKYSGSDMAVVLGKARQSLNKKAGVIACSYYSG